MQFFFATFIKKKLRMRRIALLGFLILFLSENLTAQNTILPLTGTKIFPSGLNANTIDISVDGYLLISNTVPLNKEVVFKIIYPEGFTLDAQKRIFPAAEVTVSSVSGAVLGKTADAFAAVSSSGYTADKAKELIVKTGLDASVVKGNTALNITINLSDRKSKNTLKLVFPLTIATAKQGLQASTGVSAVKCNTNDRVYTSNLKIASATTSIDNEIKVNPAISYRSLELSSIIGATIDEVAGGKEQYFVYNANTLEPVKMTEKLLKRVKAGVEGNVSSYLLKIPAHLKTDKTPYIARFRWESVDGKRVIDAVFNE